LPSSLARQGATASLAAESARLSAVAAWEATRAFAPFIAIGGGVDRIVLETGPAPAGAWASGADTRIDPMLEGMLGAKMRFSTLVGAFFGFAMDVDLAPHRYVIDEGGAKETFFDLGRVRPTALVGLSMLVADTGNRATSAEAGP